MEDITGKREKRITVQVELTPENEANICKYQGHYLTKHYKRISKVDVINKAIADFFKYNLDEHV